MFKARKHIQSAIQRLYENLKDMDYDTKYSWRRLKELTGNNSMNQDDLYYVANKVSLMLMDNDQRSLITINGYGKRIIKPEEHNYFAKKTVKKSVKIYRKAGKILGSCNLDELNDDQKKEVIESANKYRTLEMFTQDMLKRKKIGQSNKKDVQRASLFLDAIKLFTDK